MSKNADQPVMSLGSDFEVLEDGSTPAAATGAAAAPGAPSATDPPFGPIRSANAWASLGLSIALAGMLGPWAAVKGDLVHGFLLTWTLWFLIRGGFLAVQRTGQPVPVALPAALLLYGIARIATSGSGLEFLGWDATVGALDASGAFLTTLGGLLALAMPRTVAKKKDAKLPPPGVPLSVDKQFRHSLFAYLAIFVGLLMPWASEARGVDSLAGVITLLLAMLMVWASWVAMWQLWQKPLVMGKLGMLLFLAPLEAVFVGFLGIVLAATDAGSENEYIAGLHNAYPGDVTPFFAYAGGPLLVTLGSLYAIKLIFSGAKEAQAMLKERKAQEIEARKAKRASKKGGAGKSAAAGKKVAGPAGSPKKDDDPAS